MKLLQYLSINLLLLVLIGPPVIMAQSAAQPTVLADHDMVIFFLAPLVDIHAGDTVTLEYIIEDLAQNGGITLAPLTYGDAAASAQLGTATVTPDGLHGAIVYRANQPGEEVISLTISNSFGTANGTFQFTVKPRPIYALDFLIVSEAEDEAGGAFRRIFSGEGEFAKVPNAAIQGQGSADFWFVPWITNQVFACKTNPVVQGTTTFQISGQPGLIPLLAPPGFVQPFTLDLLFKPVSLNGSRLTCKGQGEMNLTDRWPASERNPNEYPLKGHEFPGDGGVIEITGNKTHGFIAVTRMDP